ncbi:MAG: putative ABC transporter permease [Oscillospiraceae bacterium]|nr:putative ABC transporter permease [Oscillospiraceae bacterium]
MNKNITADKTALMKFFTLFLGGGIIYGGIEVLIREYTHISMIITGGLCFVLIGALRYSRHNIPVTVRMLIGALIITALELASGLIVNVWLGLNVWDYSYERGNYLGQICLRATSFWVFLSFIAVYLDVFARRGMFKERTSPMRILP